MFTNIGIITTWRDIDRRSASTELFTLNKEGMTLDDQAFIEWALVLPRAVENSGESMPIYEYYCESCDCQFETLMFRSTDPVACPTCNTHEVKRVLSVFGFKSGGDKGAASSRMGSGASGCSGCAASNCSSCH